MRRKMGVDGGKEEKREGYDVGRMLGGGRKGRASLTNLKVGNASTMHGRGGLGCCRGSGGDMTG